MRLTDDQTQVIRRLDREVGGSQSRVRVFGSRLDDTAHGGDLDLMLELPEPVDNPALMAVQLARSCPPCLAASRRTAQRAQPDASAHPQNSIQRGTACYDCGTRNCNAGSPRGPEA